MKKVYGLIRRLGANSKYKGYFFVAEAVKIEFIDMLAYYLREIEEEN